MPWMARDLNGDSYQWHLCSEEQGVSGCVGSPVCQQTASSNTISSCGTLSTQQWSSPAVDNGSSVLLSYSNGTVCANGVARSTTFNLFCGPYPAVIEGLVNEDASQVCHYEITMRGREFCGFHYS
jgi:Glucosidase II beta subunit-like protein